jgi:hypothetical protein
VYNSEYAAAHNATPGSTRCQWNRAPTKPPCEELAFPILNMWPHTLGTYALPALFGAEWGGAQWGGAEADLALRPPAYAAAADAEYTIFTPLVSASRAAGNATACELAGHWAPDGAAGDGVRVRVYLAAADAARCSQVAVNGGAWAPAAVVNGSVLIDGVLDGVPPVFSWELR